VRPDVRDELAVLRAWRDVQAPSEARDATVAGFLWALALVADVEVSELRARMDGPREPAAAFRPAEPVVTPVTLPWSAPVGTEDMPAWPGLGIARIERTREAGDGPAARPRAFTAGPDGRPVALAASYAEMAADEAVSARGLSDDTPAPETGADVLTDTTT
jgi:hypothetical protein